MKQRTLFDRARKGRDQALEEVERNAQEEWKDLALQAIYRTALTCEEFHVDDVWVVGDLPRTREDRALGPQMLKAARLGWCVKTDRVRPSVRSHLSGKPVWRSLIYKSEAA